MNFALGEEQVLLKQVARELLAAETPPEHVLEMGQSEPGYSEALWKKITELGWPGLTISESLGGGGGNLIDAAVLCEEAGRSLLPAPLFASIALGALPLGATSGSVREKVLKAIVDGAVVTTGIYEPDGGYDLSSIRSVAEATRDGFRIDGVKAYVSEALTARGMIVFARRGSADLGAFWIDLPADGLTIERIPTLDWGRQDLVRLDGVEIPKEHELDGVDPERTVDVATALLAAEMVGGAERAMELAVDWAKTRVQFGRAIGSFQAVSHACADMLVQVEAARSLAYYACLALEEGREDARAATSTAKAYVSAAYSRVAEASLQIHGGMGYTWEHPIHLYLRRARASAVRFGDVAWHRERSLRELGWGEVPAA